MVVPSCRSRGRTRIPAVTRPCEQHCRSVPVRAGKSPSHCRLRPCRSGHLRSRGSCTEFLSAGATRTERGKTDREGQPATRAGAVRKGWLYLTIVARMLRVAPRAAAGMKRRGMRQFLAGNETGRGPDPGSRGICPGDRSACGRGPSCKRHRCGHQPSSGPVPYIVTAGRSSFGARAGAMTAEKSLSRCGAGGGSGDRLRPLLDVRGGASDPPSGRRCAMAALLIGYARVSTDQQDLTA